MAIKTSTLISQLTSFGTYPRARKTTHTKEYSKNLSNLLGEAKTMSQIGGYQENIVNLLGIAVNVQGDAIKEVVPNDI